MAVVPTRGQLYSPRGYLATSGNIFGSHNWGRGVLLAFVGRANDAAKYPTMLRTALYNKD